jgi:hypothetical protein
MDRQNHILTYRLRNFWTALKQVDFQIGLNSISSAVTSVWTGWSIATFSCSTTRRAFWRWISYPDRRRGGENLMQIFTAAMRTWEVDILVWWPDKNFSHFSAILTFIFVDWHLPSLSGHCITAFRAIPLVARVSTLVRNLGSTGRTAAVSSRTQAFTAHPTLSATLPLSSSSSLHVVLLF